MVKSSEQICFLGLCDENGREVGASDYARVAIPISGFALMLDNEAHLCLINTVEISFGEAASDWGRIAGFGLHEARQGGRLILCGRLHNGIDVGQGDRVALGAGAMRIVIAKP